MKTMRRRGNTVTPCIKVAARSNVAAAASNLTNTSSHVWPQEQFVRGQLGVKGYISVRDLSDDEIGLQYPMTRYLSRRKSKTWTDQGP